MKKNKEITKNRFKFLLSKKIFFVFLFLSLFPKQIFANCENILEKQSRKEAVEFARSLHKSNPEFYKSAEVKHEDELNSSIFTYGFDQRV